MNHFNYICPKFYVSNLGSTERKFGNLTKCISLPRSVLTRGISILMTCSGSVSSSSSCFFLTRQFLLLLSLIFQLFIELRCDELGQLSLLGDHRFQIVSLLRRLLHSNRPIHHRIHQLLLGLSYEQLFVFFSLMMIKFI